MATGAAVAEPRRRIQQVAAASVGNGLNQRLHDLLSDDTGQIRPELRALHHNLLEAEHPETVLSWLNKKTTRTVVHRRNRTQQLRM